MAVLKSGLFTFIVLTALMAVVSCATNNKATQILRMASLLLYRAPAGNGYVRAFELNPFDTAYKLIRANVAVLATKNCGKRKREIGEDLPHATKELSSAEVSDIDEFSEQQKVLSILDTEEGQRLVVEHLPANERELFTEEREKRAAKVLTWTYYIPSGNLQGKSKSYILLARVRNAMTNKYSFRLLNEALVDGTARKALLSITTCSSRLAFSSFISQRG